MTKTKIKKLLFLCRAFSTRKAGAEHEPSQDQCTAEDCSARDR
jgi:hypothetical protein